MAYTENKQEICDLLLKALQATRNLSDLDDLMYLRPHEDFEIVIATFSNGHQKKINVSLDSGTAMIRDIMRHID